MEEKVVKPKVNDQVNTQAGSAAAPQSVPPHLQKQPDNQRQVPTEQNTEGDQLHPQEVNVDPNNIEGLIPQDHYRTSPLFYEIANYFGLESQEFDTAANKLSVIVDWAIKEVGSNAPQDILTKIRELEDSLMPPSWDEKRYSNVYKYLRLALTDKAYQQAMAAYRRDGGKK